MDIIKKTVTVIFMTAFFIFSIQDVLAQNKESITVSGHVKDSSGEPLAGVSVMVPGTQTGICTGYDGDYSLQVTKGSTLRFSFIGFETVDIVALKDKYDVVLKEEASVLEHVVVTGYSQVELRKSTGAVGIVSAEELKDSPLKNMDQLLQGKLAGVNVQMSSGRPGAVAKVRIRGTNTITGNAEPLWVVDGVPLQKNVPTMNNSQIKAGDFDNIFTTGIGNINPNDIESITVLKDAAAAAIYGSQAANGVIVVTTKRGQAGKTSVSYMGSVSVQTKPSRSPDLMTSAEKIAWEKELWDEFSANGFSTGEHFPKVGIVGMVRGGYKDYAGWSVQKQEDYFDVLASQSTDWFDVLFRNTVSTSHFLSLSGGSDKMTYYVSGGYTYNNGVVIKTNSQSANFSAKIDTRPAKWIKLGFQTDLNYSRSLAPSHNVNLFEYAYFANPYEKLYNDDGSYKADMTYFSLSDANGYYGFAIPDQGFNIMREIKETSAIATSASANLQGNATINICRGLTFTGLASFSYNGDASENINGKNTYAAWEDRPFENNSQTSKRTYGSITQVSSFNTSWLLRGQLNFARQFKDAHNLSVIAGAEIRSSYAKSITSKRYGYDDVTGNHSTPLFPTAPDGTIDNNKLIQFGSILDASTGQSIIEDAFASFYGTATYSYFSRYVISGTVRTDGSNNFGNDQQFNANWSVSGAWNIDQEKWMQSVSDVLSSLGIRAGFGYTGGVNRSVSPVLIMKYDSTFRNTDEDAYRKGRISNPPNPNLRWEKNRTINAGINVGFLNDRITAEFSYYHNKNLDQVTNVRVPSTTGFTSQAYNTSEQVNHGMEISLGATILKFRNFSWRLNANAAYNYNELTKYQSPTGSLTGDYYVGYPLGKIFTGKPLGINPQTGIYNYELRPDVIISDISDYRKYQNYLYYVGTSNAPWNGGFSTTFTYRNWSLNIVGNMSFGGKIINDIVSPAYYGLAGSSKNEPIQTSKSDLYVNHLNVIRAVTHRWTVNNPITDGYPRLIDAFGQRLTAPDGSFLDSNQPYSDTIGNSNLLETVSYFKLSSVSLSFNFPDRWIEKMRIGGMGMSFLMNNLFFITNYSGIDPEVPGATYPQSRSFTFSLNISF